MKVLAISSAIPEYDKYAGDLRFCRLLKIVAEKHSVGLYPIAFSDLDYRAHHPEQERYAESLQNNGVVIEEGGFSHLLRSRAYDVLFFEFYGTTSGLLKEARIWLPNARIVVDSIDVHCRRLLAKADITRKPEDFREVERVKNEELVAYAAADMVVTVNDPDREFLLREVPRMRIEILPLIYTNFPSLPDTVKERNSLLFVGNFNHEPNADAMRYFCGDILPLIIRKKPDVRVTLIGSNPPEDIRAVTSANLQVLGYVQDLNPYLQSASVSIAPMRFGAGMNGKVGEAMAYGLPVVTSSVGADGFGVKSEEDMLIADTPAEFAESVLRLLDDSDLHVRLATNGQAFIKQHFSEDALRRHIFETFERVLACEPKRASVATKLLPKLKYLFDRHFGWRINQNGIAKGVQ